MLDPRSIELNERKAQILKAVAHPLRVAIVEHLVGGERSVTQITEHLGATQSNVSRHLAVMHRSGVLRSRKEGLSVFYALRTPCIHNFLNCAAKALEHNVNEAARVLKHS